MSPGARKPVTATILTPQDLGLGILCLLPREILSEEKTDRKQSNKIEKKTIETSNENIFLPSLNRN